MKDYMLEACVDSTESARFAAENGAGRLELCASLVIGGTTPTLALFEEVRKYCKCRIHVLIRPRFGDFCYSEAEFAVIKKEIIQFEKAGADGIVIGILKPDGSLWEDRMRECIGLAENMSVTLHRAFDVCREPYEALEQAVEMGIDTILTSGQEADVIRGLPCLKKLKEQARGRIAIMAGGGVRPENIEEIYRESGITSFHMSGKKVVSSAMKFRRENVPMGLPGFDEFQIWQTDGKQIAEADAVLQRL